MTYLFTSESVTEGHPDKVCDQISDAILDSLLLQDPDSRVACETVTATGLVMLTGEITSKANIDYNQVVRKTLRKIGYTDASLNFSDETCSVQIALNRQSPEISEGVSHSLETRDCNNIDIADTIGAGDQGIMFGYACDETPELMPFPIALAHRLALKLSQVRKQALVDYLRPDGKTQVTIEYDNNNEPVRIDTILISTQHAPNTSQEQIRQDLITHVITPVLENYSLNIDSETKIITNPSGSFTIGGPHGDAGLTGRKIIVDTYGGYGRHGGGAFSGKDSTKVDRTATYMARYIAKNIVAAGLARKCEIQVSYAIGMAQPVSVTVFTQGTGIIPEEQISELINSTFDLRPYSIIENFQMKLLPQLSKDGTFFQNIASYGHFGRSDIKLPWEELDKVQELKDKSASLLQTV